MSSGRTSHLRCRAAQGSWCRSRCSQNAASAGWSAASAPAKSAAKCVNRRNQSSTSAGSVGSNRMRRHLGLPLADLAAACVDAQLCHKCSSCCDQTRLSSGTEQVRYTGVAARYAQCQGGTRPPISEHPQAGFQEAARLRVLVTGTLSSDLECDLGNACVHHLEATIGSSCWWVMLNAQVALISKDRDGVPFSLYIHAAAAQTCVLQ